VILLGKSNSVTEPKRLRRGLATNLQVSNHEVQICNLPEGGTNENTEYVGLSNDGNFTCDAIEISQ
jgi:hypothetical protein